MAVYKVPQDVEADDKLIGPFTFRQFIYLIIVAMAIALAWALGQLFIGLAVIPVPVIIFFGALALPLKKDQPMEIYLAAMVSFFLKPHRRIWDPDGIETLIEITAPKVAEEVRDRDLSQEEAAKRLSYLANIVDSGGWAIRGANAPNTGIASNTDLYLEAQSAEDVLDVNTNVAKGFNEMMLQSNEKLREEAREKMQQAKQVTTTPSVPVAFPVQTPPETPAPQFNPYPSIQQTVVEPLNDPSHSVVQKPAPTQNTPTSTSDSPISAGIINLANNSDLSIETIAHEAQRLKKKSEEADEVFISLR